MQTSQYSHGILAPSLFVDEASMMVLPHFLALATLARDDSEIMLAGDHRQLAPIVAHDWDVEDRPPIVLYQPFVSVYTAIQSIKEKHEGISDRSITISRLQLTYRLPQEIIELISGLYRKDGIELSGLPRREAEKSFDPSHSWGNIWKGDSGLFLVVHGEEHSTQSNRFEVDLISEILRAAPEPLEDSVAIVTPHRAQRSLLKRQLSEFNGFVRIIDTVERLQGGERPVIIFSGTVSDRTNISSNVKFILSLNRSNVAFSRPKNRLIVVCSRNLLDYIPPDLNDYESTMLWKSLRLLCSKTVFRNEYNGVPVHVHTAPL